MQVSKVTVVGAGIGGLVAALDLAVQGLDVTLLERAATPGGKMRELEVAGQRLDAGPTVFTMRRVFEEIFDNAGTSLSDHLTLKPVDILARHGWTDGTRLDLYADIDRSADAIARFAGAAAGRAYKGFCERSRRIYEVLEEPFIRSSRPTPISLAKRIGIGQPSDLWRISPFSTLWGALGDHFADPKLRQLFGRYATYCGSSPFLAPATLMLIAHVERDGVWLVEGGMHRLATSLAALAQRHGVAIRYGAHVNEILVAKDRVAGVRFNNGEQIASNTVVLNADIAALAGGCFGTAAAGAVAPVHAEARSLSAMTWSLVADTDGFPLSHHTVFFSSDYQAEFRELFQQRRMPSEPTVYVCAQDRDDQGKRSQSRAERLLCLINAPANGDVTPFTPTEIEQCAERSFRLMERCGLTVQRQPDRMVVTTPNEFDRLFPATGGALYGQASHGWQASFQRPGARTKIPGLYLAGGSTHPGAGVPMAALSGRQAAASLLADLASTSRSRRAGTRGGMSMA